VTELVSFIIQGYHGLGRHQQTLSESDLAAINQAVFFQSLIAAIVAYALLKISIALFLLRLGKNNTWFRRTLWAVIAFIVVYTLFAFFSFTFRCSPVSGAWDTTINAKCYSWTFFVGTALTNTGKYIHFLHDIWIILTLSSVQHVRRCRICDYTYPNHLEPADVAANTF
jgi:hypothetical protein